MSGTPKRPRTASSISSSVNRRGGGGVRAAMPHQLYMRLTCLEMERHRRGIEREAAMTRVRACDERTRELEAEMAEIKGELRRRRMIVEDAVETVGRPAPPRTSSPDPAATPGRTRPAADPGDGGAPVPFKY